MIRRPPRSTQSRSSAASDVYKRQGQKPDENRKPLEGILTNHQLTLLSYDVVADDRQAISRRLVTLCETTAPHIILTLGGTGVRPTDWAPEATRDVIEKEIPGIG